MSERTFTPIDAIAEEYLDAHLELVPEDRVYLGRPGKEAEYSDYSPAGAEALVAVARQALARISAAEPQDDVDRVTKLDLTRTLELAIAKHEAGFGQRNLNVIASPAQELRDIFDLMPTATETDWNHIADRMRNLPAAMAGYQESLRSGVAAGNVPAIRQVEENITAAEKQLAGDAFFFELAAGGIHRVLEYACRVGLQLTFGDRPSVLVFARPERPAHVGDPDLPPRRTDPVEQDAGAPHRHGGQLTRTLGRADQFQVHETSTDSARASRSASDTLSLNEKVITQVCPAFVA